MYSHLQQESWTLRYLKLRPLDYHDTLASEANPRSIRKYTTKLILVYQVKLLERGAL